MEPSLFALESARLCCFPSVITATNPGSGSPSATVANSDYIHKSQPTGSDPFHPSRGPLAAILPLFPLRVQLPIRLGLNLLLMPGEREVYFERKLCAYCAHLIKKKD